MLLIASMSSDLPNIQDEIMGAVNDLGADLALVDDGLKVSELLSVGSYRIVWFAGHGNSDGVWLSPTHCLNAETLVPSMRNRGIRLIVLNSCDSESLAYALHAETKASVVYTEAAVQDDAAFAVAKRFFSELKSGASYREAFDNSKSKHFRMIDGYDMKIATEDKVVDMLHALDKRISIIETRLEMGGAGKDKWYWTIVIVGLVASLILFLLLWGDIAANEWFSFSNNSARSLPFLGSDLPVILNGRPW